MVRLTIFELLDQFKLAKDNPLVATHYGLDGRKYHIPDTQNVVFLTALSYAFYTNKRRLYLIERKTEVFKMHMDLDFVQRTIVTLDDVKTLTRMLTVIMRSFYLHVDPEEARKLFGAVILAAPAKKTTVAGEEMIKSGYHIIWPFLNVTTPQALAMRYACVIDAEQRLPERQPPVNAYNDILDECVLKENGLRMIGNDKCTPCKCSKKRDENRAYSENACHTCEHTRVIPENRPYWPVAMLDGNGNTDQNREVEILGFENCNYLYKVMLCSTRNFKPCTPGFQQPLLAPVCPSRKPKRTHTATIATEGRVLSSVDRVAKKFKEGIEIAETTETFIQIQLFLRTRMGDVYENICLKKLLLMPNGFYICNVSGAGSSFCRNVDRAHQQSHIYFRIDEKKGVYQRCFCSKNNATGNKVACKYYNGPSVHLSGGLQAALFTMGKSDLSHANVGSTPQTEKMAAIDSVLEHIEQHILENRVADAGLTATTLAVAAKREQELRLAHITGRTISTNVVVQKTAPGVKYTWRELDGLSMKELMKVDEIRAKDEAALAIRMHSEVKPVAVTTHSVLKPKPKRKNAK